MDLNAAQDAGREVWRHAFIEARAERLLHLPYFADEVISTDVLRSIMAGKRLADNL